MSYSPGYVGGFGGGFGNYANNFSEYQYLIANNIGLWEGIAAHNYNNYTVNMLGPMASDFNQAFNQPRHRPRNIGRNQTYPATDLPQNRLNTNNTQLGSSYTAPPPLAAPSESLTSQIVRQALNTPALADQVGIGYQGLPENEKAYVLGILKKVENEQSGIIASLADHLVTIGRWVANGFKDYKKLLGKRRAENMASATREALGNAGYTRLANSLSGIGPNGQPILDKTGQNTGLLAIVEKETAVPARLQYEAKVGVGMTPSPEQERNLEEIYKAAMIKILNDPNNKDDLENIYQFNQKSDAVQLNNGNALKNFLDTHENWVTSIANSIANAREMQEPGHYDFKSSAHQEELKANIRMRMARDYPNILAKAALAATPPPPVPASAPPPPAPARRPSR